MIQNHGTKIIGVVGTVIAGAIAALTPEQLAALGPKWMAAIMGVSSLLTIVRGFQNSGQIPGGPKQE